MEKLILKMSEYKLAFISVAFLVILSVGCAKKDEKEIKIGAVLPLTGSAAVWGENAKRGMDLALKEVNEEGGVNGRKLEIVYEDSQSEPTKATSSLQKVITTDRVQVVIGDIASSSVLAMAPIAEKAKVVLLSPGASNPDISKAGEYIFRNWQSDALEGEENAKFAYEQLGYRKVACLYIDNAYGTGLMTVFAKHFTELGGTVLVKESFFQGAVDMKTQLIKIKEAKPDVIYMPGYPPEMAIVLKQAKELKISIPSLSTQAFDDPKILELTGKAADGVIFSVPKPPDPSEKNVGDFINKYRVTYNKDPGVTSDTGYDAVKIIAWAIENGAQTGPQIKDQLLKLKNFPGVAGSTTFDENGDVIKPFIFKTVREGTFSSYKTK